MTNDYLQRMIKVLDTCINDLMVILKELKTILDKRPPSGL